MRTARRRAALMLAVLSAAFVGSACADSYLDAIGGSGGGQFQVICPAGLNVIGFALRAADDVDAIQPFCGKAYAPGQAPKPAGAMGGGFGFSSGANAISTGAGAPWQGGQGGSVRLLMCPPSTPVVIGIDVAAEGVDTIVVNNIHLFCGQVVVPQSPPAYPSAIFDAPGYVPSKSAFGIGIDGDPARVRTGSERCPADQIAIGMHGRSGLWLDAMGLICGQPRVEASRAPVKSLGRVNTGTPSPHPPGWTICDAARDARARNSPAAPNLEAQCAALKQPVKSLGRVNTGTPSPRPSGGTICDAARAARARNSPAAPNLEAQCAAMGEPPPAAAAEPEPAPAPEPDPAPDPDPAPEPEPDA